jgi:hypothetical protein
VIKAACNGGSCWGSRGHVWFCKGSSLEGPHAVCFKCLHHFLSLISWVGVMGWWVKVGVGVLCGWGVCVVCVCHVFDMSLTTVFVQVTRK